MHRRARIREPACTACCDEEEATRQAHSLPQLALPTGPRPARRRTDLAPQPLRDCAVICGAVLEGLPGEPPPQLGRRPRVPALAQRPKQLPIVRRVLQGSAAASRLRCLAHPNVACMKRDKPCRAFVGYSGRLSCVSHKSQSSQTYVAAQHACLHAYRRTASTGR
jgi:hypothetical protein